MSKRSTLFILVVLLAFLGVVGTQSAARTNSYHIERWTVDNGGGVSVANQYRLMGTIGQSDASTAMEGGVYSLTGGYWGVGHRVFLPFVLRS